MSWGWGIEHGVVWAIVAIALVLAILIIGFIKEPPK
jgi:hypothetical protein